MKINKDQTPTSYRTDRIANAIQQVGHAKDARGGVDSHTLDSSNERAAGNNNYTKVSQFVSLNTNENVKTINIEHEDETSKSGKKSLHHKEYSFNAPHNQNFFERSPKIELGQKPKTIRISHHPSKSLSKGSVASSRLSSNTKSVYGNGFKNLKGRENQIIVSTGIERHRSESNNINTRKKLIEKELFDNSPNPNKETFHSKIENHVTKFSFATKAGRSVRNPKKKNQDQYIVEPMLCGLRDVHLFGICDGHGVNGKQVSSFIKHELPRIFAYYLDCLFAK